MNVSFCGCHFLLRWMHFNKMHTQIVELMEFNISNTCVTSWYGLMEIGGKIQFNDGLFVMYLRIMHIVKYFVQFYDLIGAENLVLSIGWQNWKWMQLTQDILSCDIILFEKYLWVCSGVYSNIQEIQNDKTDAFAEIYGIYEVIIYRYNWIWLIKYIIQKKLYR